MNWLQKFDAIDTLVEVKLKLPKNWEMQKKRKKMK